MKADACLKHKALYRPYRPIRRKAAAASSTFRFPDRPQLKENFAFVSGIVIIIAVNDSDAVWQNQPTLERIAWTIGQHQKFVILHIGLDTGRNQIWFQACVCFHKFFIRIIFLFSDRTQNFQEIFFPNTRQNKIFCTFKIVPGSISGCSFRQIQSFVQIFSYNFKTTFHLLFGRGAAVSAAPPLSFVIFLLLTLVSAGLPQKHRLKIVSTFKLYLHFNKLIHCLML